jgi:hypothetical protein
MADLTPCPKKYAIMNRMNQWAIVFWILLVIVTRPCFAAPCPPFFLRTDTNQIINPISGENAHQPYSTRQTCGACHDVEKIGQGYHFIMDWDKADDHRFKDKKTPWLVSTGLTGGLTPVGFFLLAKKENTFPEEMDLTSFNFISRFPKASKGYQKPGCAGCHPGGGMLERDREGFRYDQRLTKNPGLTNTLDGDYYQSRWDKTGVIEPDCFFCHSSRYQMQTRFRQLKQLNFKWAGVAASGIGQVTGRVDKGEIPRVLYNRRLFNQDGSFVMPEMVFKPRAENCLLCHATIDMGKRGTTWNDPLNPDVHHLAGLTCIDCHFGDINHNFAKGNAAANTVRDDLDNTMRSCRDCHTTGYKGATRMVHQKIRKHHLDTLSCEACHIPQLNRSAIGAMCLNTGQFGKHGQINTHRYGEPEAWKPAYVIRRKDRDQISRITPVNPIYASLFTNRETNGNHVPLFLSEVKIAYEGCKDQMRQKKPPYDFHAPRDIVLMLNTLTRTLADNRRFSTIAPCFHDGDTLYFLNTQSALTQKKDSSWVSKLPYFSISHNVAPAHKALGANGCTDCHAKDAHLFNGRVVTDYFSNKGNPVTIPMAAFLGLPPATQTWNHLFGVYLKIAPGLFLSGGALLILLIGFNLFLKKPILPGGVAFQSLILMVAFFLGHLLILKDLGGVTTLFASAMKFSDSLGLVFILVSFIGMGTLIRKRIRNKKMWRILLALGLMIAVTGLALWHPPWSTIAPGLFFPMAHGLLIILIVCIFLGLVLFKTDKMS